MSALETVRPQGDRVANTTHDLYRQYGRQIYAYCFHKLRSREEAEDAVQTTFMNAFRALQRGTAMQFEQAWLYKIAQNVCFERSSSSSRRRLHEAPNDFEVLQEVVPAREGEGSLELMGLEEALETMPENQRRAILLREWQGLSYREISDELGLSQAAVEMLIFRARRALAGALEQPDEARTKRRRVGRGVTVGGLLSALKTLLGGGAAIKAVAAAAAAVVVVGESAQYTVVNHARPARGARSSAALILGRHADATDKHAVASSADVVEPSVVAALAADRVHRTHAVAKKRVAVAQPLAASRHAVTGQAGLTVTRPAVEAPPAPPAPPAPVATAPAPAAAPSPAPVSAPPPKVAEKPASPAPPAPAAVPAVTMSTLAAEPPPAPAAAPGNSSTAPGHNKEAPPADPPAVTTVAAPALAPPAPAPAPAAAPGNSGNAPGHNKDAPPADPPAVTTTVAAPAPPPAPSDNGHGNGNGNGNGRGKP